MGADKRVYWIDCAKALAMVLIVLGHVLRAGVIRNMVYALNVPVFFFLAGMTVKEDCIKKRIFEDTKRLLVPYVFFGIVSIVVYLVLGSYAASQLDERFSGSLWSNTLELFLGSCRANRPLWFLPSLFVTKLMYYFLNYISKGNRLCLVLFAVIGSIISFFYTNMNLWTIPFSLEVTLKLFVFFVAGKLCLPILYGVSKDNEQSCKYFWLGVALLATTFALAAFFPPVNYTNNSFPAPLGFYVAASIGCVAVCLLSMKFQNVLWLRTFGLKTLAVLVMHKFPVVFFQTVGPFKELLKNPGSLKSFFLGAFPVTTISIVLCVVVGCVIEKVFPCLLGASKKALSIQH